ncbi:MAG: Formyltetrahydrofolate deformylase [Chlamydiia bacterium]|nr:Formyltetrahydrofolate deformylase [Chlamydiia bacterium]
MESTHYIITAICDDQIGIVAALCQAIAEMQGDIHELQQHSEYTTGKFFVRIAFETSVPKGEVEKQFSPIIQKFSMDHKLTRQGERVKTVVLVSKESHCLNHLLYLFSENELNIEITAIISNHNILEKMAKMYDLPFHHLPITIETKPEQEAQIGTIIKETGAELIILAKYMQIMSEDFCRTYEGQVINIHHSCLPSFKGAKPYKQAYDRGVKLIGATGHLVTADLDEGPIIHQAVKPVTHCHTDKDMVRIGREVEAAVLSHTVRLFSENRVLRSGNKTIVFSK